MTQKLEITTSNTRIGIHYAPDTPQFRQKDLDTWLPQLKSLEVGWIVLDAPREQAIPEYFLSGLIRESIQPILRMDYALESPPKIAEISMLFEAYAHWGVKYIIPFDRPNVKKSWPAAGWARQDLVERFLDRFIPIASLALQHGLRPVFPALEPGGDYWDIAFLKSCLEGLQIRHQNSILDNLVLAAYGFTSGHDLNWGAGGPDRWPEAHPYGLPEESQDQRGFRIFDWYNAIAEAVTGKTCPIILLEAGRFSSHTKPEQLPTPEIQAATNLALIRLLESDLVENPADSKKALDPIPSNVIACAFWVLTAPNASEEAYAWYGADQSPSPTVKTIVEWQSTWIKSMPVQVSAESARDSRPGQDDFFFDPAMDFDDLKSAAPAYEIEIESEDELIGKAVEETKGIRQFVIQHYVLLPSYDWGIPDLYLDAIRPFIKKYHATSGFSLEEASCAAFVTVIGGEDLFTEEDLDTLRFNGAVVERISGDGTSIASVLEQR